MKLPFDLSLHTAEILDYWFNRKADQYKLEQFMKYKIKDLVDKIHQAKGWSSKQ